MIFKTIFVLFPLICIFCVDSQKMKGLEGIKLGDILGGLTSKITPYEKSIDTLFANLYRYGDSNRPMEVDLAKYKANLEVYKKELELEKKNITKNYKGLTKKVAETTLGSLISWNDGVLSFLESDEELVPRTSEAINKLVKEASKVRTAFQAAMTEAALKTTKATFATLICYIRVYSQDLENVYKDEAELNVLTGQVNKKVMGSIAQLLVKEKGEATTDCKLPESGSKFIKLFDSKSGPFESVFLPLFKAVENLEKK